MTHEPASVPGRLACDVASIINPSSITCGPFTATGRTRPAARRPLHLAAVRLALEAIAGIPLQRDAFRRAMEPHLLATGEIVSQGRSRPAELFRRRICPARRR